MPQLKQKCEVCGKEKVERVCLKLVVDDIIHWLCHACCLKCDRLSVNTVDKAEEVQCVGHIELKDGDVVMTFPDYGFARAYEEGYED